MFILCIADQVLFSYSEGRSRGELRGLKTEVSFGRAEGISSSHNSLNQLFLESIQRLFE